MTEVVGPFWKSSYSGTQSNCVEVADTTTGGRAVRDSKDQAGLTLIFTSGGWEAFLAGTRSGKFGHSVTS